MATATAQLELRPHQTETVRQIDAAFRAGMKRALAVLPTGAGKRYLAVWWAQRALEHDKQTLIVTDRRTLVTQMRDELKNYDVDYGLVMAGMPANPDADVQLASIQTLAARHMKDRNGLKANAGLPACDLLVVDEAHKELRRYAELFSHYPDAHIIGLTATPAGPDGATLLSKPLYDSYAEGALNSDLIQQGWLLPTKVLAPSEPDIKGVSVSTSGEYNQKQLGQKVQTCTLFADLWKEWEPYADRKTIVFAPSREYCRGLQAEFERRLGPGSSFLIDCDVDLKERDHIFREMRSWRGQVLVSVDVLREGFDLPEASVAIDLQPCRQLRTVWQKWGRTKRPYPGQEQAVLIDMAGNYWRHPHPDTDPSWPFGDQTTASLQEAKRESGEEKEPFCCPQCSVVWTGKQTCPECGYEIKRRMRRLRMGDGTLVEVPTDKPKKPAKSDNQKQWDSAFWRCVNSGRTVAQARYLFFSSTGTWPNDRMGLRGYPPECFWTMQAKEYKEMR